MLPCSKTKRHEFYRQKFHHPLFWCYSSEIEIRNALYTITPHWISWNCWYSRHETKSSWSVLLLMLFWLLLLMLLWLDVKSGWFDGSVETTSFFVVKATLSSSNNSTQNLLVFIVPVIIVLIIVEVILVLFYASMGTTSLHVPGDTLLSSNH